MSEIVFTLSVAQAACCLPPFHISQAWGVCQTGQVGGSQIRSQPKSGAFTLFGGNSGNPKLETRCRSTMYICGTCNSLFEFWIRPARQCEHLGLSAWPAIVSLMDFPAYGGHRFTCNYCATSILFLVALRSARSLARSHRHGSSACSRTPRRSSVCLFPPARCTSMIAIPAGSAKWPFP